MSEYPNIGAHQESSQPDGNALFDSIYDDRFKDNRDDDVEDIVDTRGVSYDDARRIVGVEAREYTTPPTEAFSDTVPTPGVAVKLADRALAIANIMDAYNYANKAAGASIARYDASSAVLQAMSLKAERLLAATEHDIRVLAGTDDLSNAGVLDSEIATVEAGIKRDLLRTYGPGNAFAKDRAKVSRISLKVAGITREPRKS